MVQKKINFQNVIKKPLYKRIQMTRINQLPQTSWSWFQKFYISLCLRTEGPIIPVRLSVQRLFVSYLGGCWLRWVLTTSRTVFGMVPLMGILYWRGNWIWDFFLVICRLFVVSTDEINCKLSVQDEKISFFYFKIELRKTVL